MKRDNKKYIRIRIISLFRQFLKTLAISILLLVTSCEESFLDKKPQGVVFYETLANPAGIEDLIIGAYNSLHGTIIGWFLSPGSNWHFGSVFADDAYTGSYLGDMPLWENIESYNLSPTNSFYEWRWSTLYDGIMRCNHILRVVDLALDMQTITETASVQYKAEALFLRAYFHLEAIKMWDFIPYSDESNEDGLVENYPPQSVESNAGDTPWGQLAEGIPWERVEEDIQFAIDNLEYESSSGAAGRANKYKAQAILARVLIYQGNYNAALPILNELINSSRYSLFKDFHTNFRVAGDNLEEAIFQIQASVNDGAQGELGNMGDLPTYPFGGGPGTPGWGFFQPSQNLVNAFKTQNGLPYLEAFGLDFNEPGDDVKNDMGISSDDTTWTPETRPLDPRLDWTVGRRDIPYLDWGDHPGQAWIRDQSWGGPYNPIKQVYYESEENTYAQASGWLRAMCANNYSIIRYADILLMAAECEVEIGSLDNARELVNQVRARARDGAWVLKNGAVDDGSHIGPNGEEPAANYEISEYPNDGGPLDPFTGQESAREAVRFERRLELGMENHRFWDLKRWGIAKSTLNEYVEREVHMRKLLNGAIFEDRHIRHPIPQSEIDLSENYLKQNPGY
jgi:hypothetical protein